jgi:hypothetical protein
LGNVSSEVINTPKYLSGENSAGVATLVSCAASSNGRTDVAVDTAMHSIIVGGVAAMGGIAAMDIVVVSLLLEGGSLPSVLTLLFLS